MNFIDGISVGAKVIVTVSDCGVIEGTLGFFDESHVSIDDCVLLSKCYEKSTVILSNSMVFTDDEIVSIERAS